MCDVSALVSVDAELDEWSVDDVSKTENVIVSQWREVSVDEQHELRHKVDEILRPLGSEIRLVVMSPASGITLYFICLTLSAVMSLRDQWHSRRLRDIVKELFTVLSTASRTRTARKVPVKRLIWPVTEYEQCLYFFRLVQGKAFSCTLCTFNWFNCTQFSTNRRHTLQK